MKLFAAALLAAAVSSTASAADDFTYGPKEGQTASVSNK
jgi:hypothetical protein